MPLLIVESPKKAKQIASYLGRDWTVKACFGDVHDLPAKKEEIPGKSGPQAWARLRVDVQGGHIAIYMERAKVNVLAKLRTAVKAAEGDVYLAL
jgi:DNA topoisomerase-1